MKKGTTILFLFNLGWIFHGASCALFSRITIPEGYIPDDKVIYLQQRTDLDPIRYEPEPADPYVWKIDPATNLAFPVYLSTPDFTSYLKPDPQLDARVMAELKILLPRAAGSEKYLKLKDILENHQFKQPEPRKVTTGEVVERFNNATKYKYTEPAGGTIIIFQNNSVQIQLPDGSQYYQDPTLSFYGENDSQKREKYAVFP